MWKGVMMGTWNRGRPDRRHELDRELNEDEMRYFDEVVQLDQMYLEDRFRPMGDPNEDSEDALLEEGPPGDTVDPYA